MPALTNTSPLVRHPATSAPAVRSFEAAIVFRPGQVVFRYCLRGDVIRLRIPAQQDPARVDNLWEHTCFEAFIGRDGDTAYREFNFSPSGQWAAYDFSGYRQRTPGEVVMPAPGISVCQTDGRLELEALVALSALPVIPAGGAWRIGLTAVVEAADTIDGGHSYWALKHPAARPDFHDRAGFVIRLPVSLTKPST